MIPGGHQSVRVADPTPLARTSGSTAATRPSPGITPCMKQRCLACGVGKERQGKETYAYHDGIITDEPIEPLMTIDCQGSGDWRVVTVCHACFHKLDVDMWISERCWRSLDPITAFEQLP